MGIGVSILLIAVGAILAFAVDYDISGLELSVVGWILLIVGVLGIILTLVIWGPRRRTATARVEERRVYDDRPPPPAV